MIELLKAFLFGIVEGITEWLPISSTGHMILLNEFVKLDVSEAFTACSRWLFSSVRYSRSLSCSGDKFSRLNGERAVTAAHPSC